MNTPNPTPQHGVTQDIPLPGFYPCLTLQLNVTRYQSEKAGRFVLVLREPSTHIEVQRSHMDVGTWPDIAAEVTKTLLQALVNMQWLQDGAQSF